MLTMIEQQVQGHLHWPPAAWMTGPGFFQELLDGDHSPSEALGTNEDPRAVGLSRSHTIPQGNSCHQGIPKASTPSIQVEVGMNFTT